MPSFRMTIISLTCCILKTYGMRDQRLSLATSCMRYKSEVDGDGRGGRLRGWEDDRPYRKP